MRLPDLMAALGLTRRFNWQPKRTFTVRSAEVIDGGFRLRGRDRKQCVTVDGKTDDRTIQALLSLGILRC